MTACTATRIAVGLLIASTLAGCVGSRSSGTPTAAGPSTATTRPAEPTSLADAKHCPATQPSPTGPKGVSPEQFFGWGASWGNGKLWVGGLWPGGVIDGTGFVDAHGAIGMKFGWWRAVPGKLRITGRRLDAAAPPAQGSVPDGYGETGFQASGVPFPTQGCWEVTGRVGVTTLTFVTLVVTPAG